MGAYEVTHRGPEVEAQEQMARVGQHHHEGHQRTQRAPHRELAEVGPVRLSLITGERAQPQVGFCRGPRTQPRHQGTEVIGAARVAAFAHHGVEPRGAKCGVLGQRLDDECPVRLDHRGPCDLVRHRHAGLGQHAAHSGVMHPKLGSNGSDRPVLGVMQTHNLGFQRTRDHRPWPRSRSPAQRTEPREARQHTPTDTAAQPRHRRAMGWPVSVRVGIGKLERDSELPLRSRFNRGDADMAPLLNGGLVRAACYCDPDRTGEGTVMRHFLRLALAPGTLPGGVRTRPAVAALVAPSGTAQRLAPADLRALPRAVPVAAVALAADKYLLGTARAVVQPIGPFADLHAPARSTGQRRASLA